MASDSVANAFVFSFATEGTSSASHAFSAGTADPLLANSSSSQGPQGVADAAHHAPLRDSSPSPDSNIMAMQSGPLPSGLPTPSSQHNAPGHTASPHIYYADTDIPEDDASRELRRLFPLLRPVNASVTRKELPVPKKVCDMHPIALMAYTVPNSPDASNVWPDRRPADNATAKYVAYPLPESPRPVSPPSTSLPSASFIDCMWSDDRERPHVNAPPNLAPADTFNPNDESARDRLPQEMFDAIAHFLSRDDMKALRLTSRRMNALASERLFNTVVVPFRQGIFNEEIRAEMKKYTGKGKSKSTAINIFKSHGHYIQRFGLSFEVTEALLAHLPKLVQHDLLKSYWGSYLWPCSIHQRQSTMPEWESIEDIVGMKEALADLTNLKELALSIDSGLGWLPGPDKSIRSQMIHDCVELFPNSHSLPARSKQAQQELWDLLKSQYSARGVGNDLLISRLYRIEREDYTHHPPVVHTGVPNELQYIDRRTLMEATAPEGESTEFCPHNGFLYSAKESNSSRSCFSHPVQPNNLTPEQLELLLKNQWAQQSLMIAYVIGIIDSETCRSITTLNLACLPGRLVVTLDREDLWDALPCLKSFNIKIMGEFRELYQDVFEEAHCHPIAPSNAVPSFRAFLRNQIAQRSNIVSLNIGWASGGENAIGILGRNKNLLPVPFLDPHLPSSVYMMDEVIGFPYVKHLTISNSWMTPRALERLVIMHKGSALAKLTLDSVSLLVIPATAGGAMPPRTERFYKINPVTKEQQTINLPHRDGSWPRVLDTISPNAHFGQYGADTNNLKDATSLKEIELISCGHNMLESNGWGLESLDREFFAGFNTAFSNEVYTVLNARRAVLDIAMWKVRDNYLGSIIPHIPRIEAVTLATMWGASFGWSDPDAKHAALLDGQKEGGSGRFSAVIRATNA
ncbi:F-box domain cyclin-like protein [Neofusicoccum parvum]|nr:F-box domain cyclin-like protein [Neofusicoccum parvum]